MALSESQKAFRTNSRIAAAASNSPPMQWSEKNSAAVKLLQEALMRHGISIPAGVTGTYFDQTAAAVRKFQAGQLLKIDGIAGRETISTLRKMDGEDTPPELRFDSILSILVQECKDNLGGFILTPYFAKAEEMLNVFGIQLQVEPRQMPPLDFNGSYNPNGRQDVDDVRRASERHTSRSREKLRVILARFTDSGVLGVTETSSFFDQDFILLNVQRLRKDRTTLLHEMIHATGLSVHDTDAESVFSESDDRTKLKPEHAKRLSESFFARRKG